MAKISGHGGFLVNSIESGNFRVDNAEYEYDYDSVNDDVTDSGSGGVAEGIPIIKRLNSFTMSVAEDDAASPLLLGMTEGEVLPALYLKKGASSGWDVIQNTIVKNVRVMNPQDKARRVALTCEYGRITRNVSAPAGFGG